MEIRRLIRPAPLKGKIFDLLNLPDMKLSASEKLNRFYGCFSVSDRVPVAINAEQRVSGVKLLQICRKNTDDIDIP